MSLCSLGTSLGEQIVKNGLQLEQQSEGYMGSWKGILMIVHLRDESRVTKASGPFDMFDVADNTKPRRLIMPRATSQGVLASGRADISVVEWHEWEDRSLPSSTLAVKRRPRRFVFITGTLFVSLCVRPKLSIWHSLDLL